MRALVFGVFVTGLAAASDAAPVVLASPHGSRSQDAYILALGESWSSSDVDMDQLVAMRLKLTGDFLWFRRGGKSYRLDDPAALKKAQACFEDLRALEPEQEAFRRREEAFDAKEEAVDHERDDVDADRESFEADSDAGLTLSESESGEIERRSAAVEAKQSELEPERQQLEAAERDLDRREEKLEQEAEAKLWRLIDEFLAAGLAKPLEKR